MKITDLQRKTIIEEINYYFKYDPYLKESHLNKLIGSITSNCDFNDCHIHSWLDIIKYYFISHTDPEGNIVSLEHHQFINGEIKENIELLRLIENKFIATIMRNSTPLYFLDVDNTLTDNAYLSPEKTNFIKDWKNKDNIILNTGKVSASIMNVIDECNLQGNYYACLNGSVIVKDGNFEIINRIGEVSKPIIEEFLKTDINFIVYYENQIHVIKELTEENIYYLKKYNEMFLDYTKPTDHARVVKVLAFIKEEEHEKEKIVRDIAAKYPNLIGVRTAAHCFEILNKDQHKGNSVKKIAEYMNKYYRCSIGVGDSMNDLRMLDYVGKGYVVSNVGLELKQYGFQIIEGTRDVDIVNILKKYE